MSVDAEELRRVRFLAPLKDRALKRLAGSMTERRAPAGEDLVTQGADAIAFFVILEGNVSVAVKEREVDVLGPGDHFGEIALIDEGTRTATVTAASDLVCFGVTFWDFRPLVEHNGVIGWKLLQSLAKIYREARQH